jgi:hypothetical protein
MLNENENENQRTRSGRRAAREKREKREEAVAVVAGGEERLTSMTQNQNRQHDGENRGARATNAGDLRIFLEAHDFE